MKKGIQAAVMALVTICAVPLFGRDDSVESQPKSNDAALAIIDFGAVNSLVQEGRGKVRIRLEAEDGTTFEEAVEFALGEDQGKAACLCFSVCLSGTQWNYAKDGNWLVISSSTNRRGARSPILRVQVSSDGTIPLDVVPTVTCTDNVTFDRRVTVTKNANKKIPAPKK